MPKIGRTASYACAVDDDAQQMLAEAEEQIEAWLCELDAEWTRILTGARHDADMLVEGAHTVAERIIERAQARAAAIVEQAEVEARVKAAAIIQQAEGESQSLLSGSARLAAMQLNEAQHEVQRARTLAAESSATATALAHAADAAATGRVRLDDLAALGSAVMRLRTELSRVVDAAFDALPAVEATAAALQLDPPTPEPVPLPVPAPRRKQGFVRRLLRI